MTNAFAKQLEDAAEAQALRVEDQIEANNHLIASIENGYLEAIRILKADFAERNKSLVLLASAIRSGTPLLPPAKQLTVVNADAVVEQEQAA